MSLEEIYEKWWENIKNSKWNIINKILIIVVYSVIVFSVFLIPIYLGWSILGCAIIVSSYLAFQQYSFRRELELLIKKVLEKEEIESAKK